MRIDKGLAMLELKIQGFGLNPTLIWDDEMAVLVDTGMPGQLEQIRLAMSKVGVPFDKLKVVILTHQDLDHIGSLPEILNHSNNDIEVYAHVFDKPYIEGTLPLINTDPDRMSKEQWASLPEQMQFLYKNPPKAKVDKTLEDGQELSYCGGIQVIFTPGHTPGHISLYLKQNKTLVAGDAMVVVDGVLQRPVSQTTLDMKTAIDSLEKFLDLDIEKVICYHGGLCSIKDKKQIEDLLN
ncbi:MBL fold metallo-hydrolase [Bacillus sp. AFS018417]|uniref:MBL fold metallo-hydrolase n=1 Tax=Bacillus cereus TaxID=1396 RepID=A0A2A7I0B7_BACCE|nr:MULTISPECIES: MBL fold metallo-hydrolase [Bacillus]PEC22610.1 MBL fold metallo-hydrolase [Bacillus cereus]PEY99017.1 MBL fold metallo-hydrolase [Bacillus sp. AFS018417]